MPLDPCVPPSSSPSHAGATHQRLPHHVVGRHVHRTHHAGSSGTPGAHPDAGCGKHFDAGHPGELATRPTDGAPATLTPAVAKLAVAGKGLAALLGAAAVVSALGLPGLIHPSPPGSAGQTSVSGGGGTGPTGPASSSPAPPAGTGTQPTPPHIAPVSPPSSPPGPTPIPEPSSAVLLAVAASLACLLGRIRRRT